MQYDEYLAIIQKLNHPVARLGIYEADIIKGDYIRRSYEKD